MMINILIFSIEKIINRKVGVFYCLLLKCFLMEIINLKGKIDDKY